MIQINIFSGQEQICRCREQTCRHEAGKRRAGMKWEIRTDVNTLLSFPGGTSGKEPVSQ